jgi:hypothetical protein
LLVKYSNQSTDPGVEPDVVIQIQKDSTFQLIGKNGSALQISKDEAIRQLSASADLGAKNVLIRLACNSSAGETATSGQKNALNDLLKGEAQVLRTNPNTVGEQVVVNDVNNLVRTDAVQALNSLSAPFSPSVPAIDQETAQNIQRIENDTQAASGTMPRDQAKGYFPKEVTPQPGESDDSVTTRQAMAALFCGKHAYSHISERSDGSYIVGAGLSFNVVDNFMQIALTKEILDALDHPPPRDYSRLAKILKEHPELLVALREHLLEMERTKQISHELAECLSSEKTAGKFGHFVEQLRGNHGRITVSELHANLPKLCKKP